MKSMKKLLISGLIACLVFSGVPAWADIDMSSQTDLRASSIQRGGVTQESGNGVLHSDEVGSSQNNPHASSSVSSSVNSSDAGETNAGAVHDIPQNNNPNSYINDASFSDSTSSTDKVQNENLDLAIQSDPVLTNTDADEVSSDLSINSISSNLMDLAKTHVDTLKDGTYVISSQAASTNVVDVKGGSAEDGVNVQAYPSNMSNAQRWKVTHDADGFITFTNVSSGKVLDVAGASSDDRANIWQYSPNGSAAQKWVVVKEGGSYRICSALAENKVIDLDGASTAPGANIQLYSSNNSDAQKWQIIDVNPNVEACSDLGVSNKYFEIVSAGNSSYALDVAGASRGNCANIQLYASNGTAAQLYTFEFEAAGADGKGYYRIINAGSDKPLEISCGSVVPGANAQIFEKNGSAAQQWSVTEGDGAYTFINRASGLALDVAGANYSNGANVWGWGPNGSAAQSFLLREKTDLLMEGIVSIAPSYTNKAIDVTGAAIHENANIQLYAPNSTLSQKYYIARVGDNTYTIQAMVSGLYLGMDGDNVVQVAQSRAQQWEPIINGGYYVLLAKGRDNLALDVAGGADSNGANVGIYPMNGSAAQKFDIRHTDILSNGIYHIGLASDRGKVVDVAGGSRDDGANVQIFSNNDTGAQKWSIEKIDNAVYKITNVKSRKMLDVKGGIGEPYTNIQQFVWNGSAAQQWKLAWWPEAGGFRIETMLRDNLDLSIDGNDVFDGANLVIRPMSEPRVSAWTFMPTTYCDAYNGNAEHDATIDRAIAYLERCTNSSMSKSDKLYAAFNYLRDHTAEFNPRIPHRRDYGWEMLYANDIFLGRGGNCMSFGASFAFIARAIGYENVYACNTGGHGWAEVDGLVYDPEWDKNHGRHNIYYAVSYDNGKGVNYKSIFGYGGYARVKI